jgi:isopropylmalate/homocitrate/citramalate synthase
MTGLHASREEIIKILRVYLREKEKSAHLWLSKEMFVEMFNALAAAGTPMIDDPHGKWRAQSLQMQRFSRFFKFAKVA